jgi:hypothetical protein
VTSTADPPVSSQPMGVPGTERSPKHPSVDVRYRVGGWFGPMYGAERYFREKAASHWLRRFFPKWDPPPPKAAIRAGIAELALPA